MELSLLQDQRGIFFVLQSLQGFFPFLYHTLYVPNNSKEIVDADNLEYLILLVCINIFPISSLQCEYKQYDFYYTAVLKQLIRYICTVIKYKQALSIQCILKEKLASKRLFK